jgi:hypothetical protein
LIYPKHFDKNENLPAFSYQKYVDSMNTQPGEENIVWSVISSYVPI